MNEKEVTLEDRVTALEEENHSQWFWIVVVGILAYVGIRVACAAIGD